MDIDSSKVGRLLAEGDWDAVHPIVEGWPDHPLKLWLQGSYQLEYKKNFAAAEPFFVALAASVDCPPKAYLRLGKSWHGQDNVLGALGCYLRALVACRQDGDEWFEHAVNSYGLACLELGLAKHWLAVLERLKAPNDQLPQTAYLKAVALLSTQSWREGWRWHEQREHWFPPQWFTLELPAWTDQPLHPDQPVVVASDMGIGDFIFFLRFIPLLRQRCAAVVALVPPMLRSFAEGVACFDQVITGPEQVPSQCSWYLKLPSICACLGLNGPAQGKAARPYLSLPVEARPERRRPLVAINWAGNRSAEGPSCPVRARSLPLELMERMKHLQDVDLISVQVGVDESISQSSLAEVLHPMQEEIDATPPDLWRTAQWLKACDLIITNDTSIAHLGGALGVETWVMLKRYPSWQWGETGESPWYESVRCFRQVINFDWSDVVAEIDAALDTYLKQRSANNLPKSETPSV